MVNSLTMFAASLSDDVILNKVKQFDEPLGALSTEPAKWRYSQQTNPFSPSRLGVVPFTLLVLKVDVTTLQLLRDSGTDISHHLRTQLGGFGLPKTWTEYHALLHENDGVLGQRYFEEVSLFFYPRPDPGPSLLQPVTYSLAHAHKQQLYKFMSRPFIERLQGLPTWGPDMTTASIRAHFVEGDVVLDIDWTDQDSTTLPTVFKEEEWGTVHVKTTHQLLIQISPERAGNIIQSIYHPTNRSIEPVVTDCIKADDDFYKRRRTGWDHTGI
ncbi:hypothetical protein BHE90_013107 [Fusarium euwallaceae]|uniref:Uncharacterized protein n=1 Tax=Fusarium euwallaceae TaxID=1147111 RepID=A0A430L9S0_9HYPO|nr:hypothetical protein BHE90_013107 [Fusarium euwallaceae]